MVPLAKGRSRLSDQSRVPRMGSSREAVVVAGRSKASSFREPRGERNGYCPEAMAEQGACVSIGKTIARVGSDRTRAKSSRSHAKLSPRSKVRRKTTISIAEVRYVPIVLIGLFGLRNSITFVCFSHDEDTGWSSWPRTIETDDHCVPQHTMVQPQSGLGHEKN